MPLRRAIELERTGNLEEAPVVVDRMNFRGVVVSARSLIGEQGPVIPAVPQRPDHIDIFGGAGIAIGVIALMVEPEVPRLAVRPRRHAVPSRAATAQMVDRRELARQMVRRQVAGRHGGDQADTLGLRRDRGEQRQRLEIIDRSSQRTDFRRTAEHRDIVGEEDRVEPGRFGSLREPDIMAQVGESARIDRRVQPCRDMVPHPHQERAEPHLAIACHGQKRPRRVTP